MKRGIQVEPLSTDVKKVVDESARLSKMSPFELFELKMRQKYGAQEKEVVKSSVMAFQQFEKKLRKEKKKKF